MIKKLDGQTVRIPTPVGGEPLEAVVNFRVVESTNVDRVGWDEAGNMYVGFKNGTMYVYLGVSRQRAVAAAYARSVGSYINRIKGNFESLRLSAA